jgi:hypothetical protein
VILTGRDGSRTLVGFGGRAIELPAKPGAPVGETDHGRPPQWLVDARRAARRSTTKPEKRPLSGKSTTTHPDAGPLFDGPEATPAAKGTAVPRGGAGRKSGALRAGTGGRARSRTDAKIAMGVRNGKT